jgi:hypothetical protein
MKLTRGSLREAFRAIISPRSENELDPTVLKHMARGIMTTRPDEIDCTECFEQVDQFVELTLAGKNAAEALPLVEDHLNRCPGCREEFEALLAALHSFS